MNIVDVHDEHAKKLSNSAEAVGLFPKLSLLGRMAVLGGEGEQGGQLTWATVIIMIGEVFYRVQGDYFGSL